MLCFHSLSHLEHFNSPLSFTADTSLFSTGPFGEHHGCVLSRSVMSDFVTHVLFCSWNSPGKSNGVGCHFLLQGSFPTQVLTRVVWGLGIRTGLKPLQKVQTRNPKQKNSPKSGAIIIEIEIFKKKFLPKYMSNQIWTS